MGLLGTMTEPGRLVDGKGDVGPCVGRQVQQHSDCRRIGPFFVKVLRWRLVIKVYAPKLLHVKGEPNIVADALSRLALDKVPPSGCQGHVRHVRQLQQ